VQLRLVADLAVEHGLDRLQLARHALEAGEQGLCYPSADPDLVARGRHPTTMTARRVIALHPQRVMPSHPSARDGALITFDEEDA
jgi:hypothetical protein